MEIKKYQPILALKPTQFSVGLMEVEYKVAEMKKLSRAKLLKLVRHTPIPVVISPWNELCLTDHHHFLFACWHAGIDRVCVEVKKDFSLSQMTYLQFWKKMAKQNLTYLYDQFGEGPRNPLYLPMDVRGLADDPYRSLAWMVRKEGGYENSTESFSEFKWADFFRKRKLLDQQGRKAFHKAIARGLKAAVSSSAQGLPGFHRKKKMTELIQNKTIVKSEFVTPHAKKGPLATKALLKSK